MLAARGLQQSPAMNRIIENLLALQELALQRREHSTKEENRIEELRKDVPESVLNQFDRWIARRRKAVAVVNSGVCGECHLRLAAGTVGLLAFGEGIQHCGNCGRLLYVPENEPVSSLPTAPPPPVATRPRSSKKASLRGR
jgi:predicted  nucleic acid-binding Zn-ribbon protein